MGEFNVDKTTGGLNPTAGMPDTYPAEQVMMSDGVTSVEDAVDGVVERMSVNALAAQGTALTYDTEYVATADGYMRGIVNEGSAKYIILFGKRTNGTWFQLAQASGGAVGAAVTANVTIFIPKGMSVKFSGSASADTSCAFVPLAST